MKRCVVALSVLAVLAASCSAQPSQPPEPGATSSAPQPPAPKPAVPVGATLHLMRIGGQQTTVTLTQIVDPATVPHGWGDPAKNYVATELTITNTGSTTIVGNANSDVVVVGSDGHDYRADFATVTECTDFANGWFLLAAGASATGCVVFGLPAGVGVARIKYMPSSGISTDVGEWLAS